MEGKESIIRVNILIILRYLTQLSADARGGNNSGSKGFYRQQFIF